MRNRKHRKFHRKPRPKFSSRDIRDSYISIQGQEVSCQPGYAPYEKFQTQADRVDDFYYSSRYNPHDYYLDWPSYRARSILEDMFQGWFPERGASTPAIRDESHPTPASSKADDESLPGRLQRLGTHVRLLRTASQDPSLLVPTLKEKLQDPSDMKKVVAVAKSAGNAAGGAVFWIGVFAPFWVRRPAAYPGHDLPGLIKHTFCVSSHLPRFMDDAWMSEFDLESSTASWLALYIAMTSEDIPDECLLEALLFLPEWRNRVGGRWAGRANCEKK